MSEVEPIARREDVAEAGQAGVPGGPTRPPVRPASAAEHAGRSGWPMAGSPAARGTFSTTSAGRHKPRVRDRAISAAVSGAQVSLALWRGGELCSELVLEDLASRIAGQRVDELQPQRD